MKQRLQWILSIIFFASSLRNDTILIIFFDFGGLLFALSCACQRIIWHVANTHTAIMTPLRQLICMVVGAGRTGWACGANAAGIVRIVVLIAIIIASMMSGSGTSPMRMRRRLSPVMVSWAGRSLWSTVHLFAVVQMVFRRTFALWIATSRAIRTTGIAARARQCVLNALEAYALHAFRLIGWLEWGAAGNGWRQWRRSNAIRFVDGDAVYGRRQFGHIGRGQFIGRDCWRWNDFVGGRCQYFRHGWHVFQFGVRMQMLGVVRFGAAVVRWIPCVGQSVWARIAHVDRFTWTVNADHTMEFGRWSLWRWICIGCVTYKAEKENPEF